MATSKAGGGIRSNKVTRPGIRTGQPRQGKNVRAVSQIGQAMGNHATDNRGGEQTKAVERIEGARGISVPLGNAVATNVGAGGPGKGRTVYGSGFQAQYGPVAGNARPQGRDILRDFGPDVGGRGRR